MIEHQIHPRILLMFIVRSEDSQTPMSLGGAGGNDPLPLPPDRAVANGFAGLCKALGVSNEMMIWLGSKLRTSTEALSDGV
jgi:hypothetical protein